MLNNVKALIDKALAKRENIVLEVVEAKTSKEQNYIDITVSNSIVHTFNNGIRKRIAIAQLNKSNISDLIFIIRTEVLNEKTVRLHFSGNVPITAILYVAVIYKTIRG